MVLALALEIRTAITADIRAFIPVETEPAHAFEDACGGFRRVAGAIGVLDAQDEGAAVLAGHQPVEQGRAGTSDVEITGGRGSEADADGHGKEGGGVETGWRQ
jgi:hypothetical protein